LILNLIRAKEHENPVICQNGDISNRLSDTRRKLERSCQQQLVTWQNFEQARSKIVHDNKLIAVDSA